MNAKYMPNWAKRCCKALHMTPREFETVNNDRSVDALADDKPVMIVKNARREVTLTAGDMRYSEKYL